MSQAFSINRYQFGISENFFLDSNVWMYLYFPQYNSIPDKIIRQYSDFFEGIVSNEMLVLTNLIQMSELINLVIRLEYKSASKSGYRGGLKDYRECEQGAIALQNAKTITENVLAIAHLQSGIFSQDEMKKMVAACDRADFNDIYFARFCEKQNATLVSHDYDFNALDQELKIASANSRYL